MYTLLFKYIFYSVGFILLFKVIISYKFKYIPTRNTFLKPIFYLIKF